MKISHSEAQFSHGICPERCEKIVRPELKEIDYWASKSCTGDFGSE